MTFLLVLSRYFFAGLAMGIGLLYPWFWPLGLAGIAALLFLLQTEETWRTRYIGAFIAWTVKGLCATAFFWSIYPIEWLPIEIGQFSLLIIAACWLGVGISLGTGGLFFVGALALIRYLGWLSKQGIFLVVPFVWLAAEVFGAYAFSIFSIGAGGTVNSYFSFGYVGYLLAEHTILLQLAMFAGVYGLVIVAVVIALVFVYFAERKIWLPLGILIFGLVATSVIPVAEPVSKESASVALITTSFPVQQLFDRTQTIELQQMQQAAFDAAVLLETDYILWPEDARFIEQELGIEEALGVFNFVQTATNTIVIDSSRVGYGNSAILQALIYDSTEETYAYAHKRYLVPQGEFVPYLYELILRGLGFSTLVDDLQNLVSYRIGPKTSQADFSSKHPGILFCFEAISPTGVRQLVQERSQVPFIAHPISHSWFHEPKEVWHQLDASLKVQVVWNRIAIASPANHAKSKVYLPNGAILEPDPVASGQFWEVSEVSIPVR